MAPTTTTIMANKKITRKSGAKNMAKEHISIMALNTKRMFFQEYCLLSAYLPIKGCAIVDMIAEIPIVSPISA